MRIVWCSLVLVSFAIENQTSLSKEAGVFKFQILILNNAMFFLKFSFSLFVRWVNRLIHGSGILIARVCAWLGFGLTC